MNHMLGGVIGILVFSMLGMINTTYAGTLSANRNLFKHVNQEFWQDNPSTGDIKRAFFGTNSEAQTAYTSGWTDNPCATRSIQVIYTGTLPNALSNNTIYVLSQGYITQALGQATRLLGECTAITTSGENIIITGNIAFIGDNSMFSMGTYSIIDNLKINCNNAFFGGDNGVIFDTLSWDNTLHNTNIFNCNQNGVLFRRNISRNILGGNIFIDSNNIVSYTNIYNNANGISLGFTYRNQIHNSKIFNNSGAGIAIGPNNGVSSSSPPFRHVINNSQIFNNSIGIQTFVQDLNFNRRYEYEYALRVLSQPCAPGSACRRPSYRAIVQRGYDYNRDRTETYIYNTHIYNNITSVITNGRGDQYINSPIYNNRDCSRKIIVSQFPYNTSCSQSGTLAWTGVSNPTWTYGNRLSSQLQPRNAVGIGTSLYYHTGLYITDMMLGGRLMLSGQLFESSEGLYYSASMNITAILNVTSPAQYVLSGDITIAPTTGSITNSGLLNLTWTGGNLFTGRRVVYVTYSTGNRTSARYAGYVYIDRDAPTTTLLSPASGALATSESINFQWTGNDSGGSDIASYEYQVSTGIGFTTLLYSGNTSNTFVDLPNPGVPNIYYRRVRATDNLGNQGNWSQIWSFQVLNPIVWKYYGSGSVYTTGWSGSTHTCDLASMNVIIIGNLPITLNQNTVYVLTGNQTFSASRILSGNCIVVAGSGSVRIDASSAFPLFINTGRQYNIIDNLTLNNQTTAINNSQSSNITVFQSRVFNGDNGIDMNNTVWGVLQDIQVYNVQNTAISTLQSQNNTYNNIVLQNCNGNGCIIGSGTTKLTINNASLSHSKNGIYDPSNSSILTLSNITTYSNSEYGLYLPNALDIRTYRSKFLNNTLGALSGTLSYFEKNKIFGNILGGMRNQGDGYEGWIIWRINNGGLNNIDTSTGTVDCNWVIKGSDFPYNSNCSTTGFQSWNPSITGSNTFGQFINTQFQPVKHINSAFALINLSRYQDLFISDKPLAARIISLSGLNTITLSGTLIYTNTTGLRVEIFASEGAQYTISGNIIGAPIMGTVSAGTTLLPQVSYTSTDGIKTLLVQLTTGGKSSEIYLSTRYLDITGPSVTAISPVDNTLSATGFFTLSWTGSDTMIGISGYTVEISTDIGFSTIYLSTGVYGTSLNLAGLMSGTYYRRVRGFDNFRNMGVNTSPRSLRSTLDPIIAKYYGNQPVCPLISSHTCDITQMQIVVGSLPSTPLSGNTIYILTGDQTLSAPITDSGAISFAGNCTAIVGSGTITLSQTGNRSNLRDALLLVNNQHNIIDNIVFSKLSTSYYGVRFIGTNNALCNSTIIGTTSAFGRDTFIDSTASSNRVAFSDMRDILIGGNNNSIESNTTSSIIQLGTNFNQLPRDGSQATLIGGDNNIISGGIFSSVNFWNDSDNNIIKNNIISGGNGIVFRSQTVGLFRPAGNRNSINGNIIKNNTYGIVDFPTTTCNGAADNTSITNNTIINNANAGIAFNRAGSWCVANNGVIRNNKLVDNQGGIFVDGRFDTFSNQRGKNFTIENNIIANNESNAIFMNGNCVGLDCGGNNHSIKNNSIIGNNGNGIVVNSANTSNIHSGQIINNTNNGLNIAQYTSPSICGYWPPPVCRSTTYYNYGYNTFRLFANGNNTASNLRQGSYTLDNSTGVMTCNYALGVEGLNLGSSCNRRGTTGWNPGTNFKYIFGEDLLKAGEWFVTDTGYVGSATMTGATIVTLSGTLKTMGFGAFSLNLKTTQPSQFIISGDVTRSGGSLTGIINDTLTVTGLQFTGQGSRVVMVQYQTGGQSTDWYAMYRELDTMSPTAVQLISPELSGSINTSNDIQLVWSSAVDTGVGMTGYYYEVATGSSFSGNVIAAGTVSSTSASVSGSLFTNIQTYYRRVFAIDKINNVSSPSTGWFLNLDPLIIKYFGSGAVYHQGWSGNTHTCSLTGMSVVIGSLPTNLTGNTIYVLTGNQTFTAERIVNGDCIVVIGSGYTVSKNSNFVTSMFEVVGKKYIVMDNLIINGSTSPVAPHGVNLTNSSDATFQNINIYGNVTGINIQGSLRINLDRISLYKNSEGFVINASRNIMFNSMNNFNNGFTSFGSLANLINNNSSGVVFNNSQFFKNHFDSIAFNPASNPATGVVFNNIYIYNTPGRGIFRHSGTPTFTLILNDFTQYNDGNIQAGFNTLARYYDAWRKYGSNNTLGSLSTGSNADALVSQVGWQDGNIDDSLFTMNCNRATSIENMSMGTNCATTGRDTFWSAFGNPIYTFGENISTQNQPVRWSGDVLINTPFAYNANLKIGDDSSKLAGNLRMSTGTMIQQSGTFYWTSGLVQTAQMYANQNAIYMITGDIQSPVFGSITGGSWTTTPFFSYTTGDGQKVVIIRFSNSSGLSQQYAVYRWLDSTGPQAPTLISPADGSLITTGDIAFSWTGADMIGGIGISGYRYQVSLMNDFSSLIASGITNQTGVLLTGFVDTSSYYRRVQAIDSVGNTGPWSTVWRIGIDPLITRYYGSGSIFTRGWQSNTCSLIGITVDYSNILPDILSGNTIYLLTEDQTTATGYILSGNCITVAGSGMVTISKTLTSPSFNMFGVDNRSNIIFDSIRINGTGNSIPNTANNGIIIISGSDSTIYGSTIYNINNIGISLTLNSNTNIINNQGWNTLSFITLSNTTNISAINNIGYNNRFHGYSIQNTLNNAVWNNLFYNNNSNGFVFTKIMSSFSNTIENNQTYNNQNNSFFFQNAPGFGFSQTVSNSDIYNNAGGIGGFGVAPITISYQDSRIFANTANYNGGGFFTVTPSGVDSTPQDMDCSWAVVIPGLDMGTRCEKRGIMSGTVAVGFKTFGSNIRIQTGNDIYFITGLYIGDYPWGGRFAFTGESVNSIYRSGGITYTNQTGAMSGMFFASEQSSYQLTGGIISLNGIINGLTVVNGIQFTGTDGPRVVTMQLTTGGRSSNLYAEYITLDTQGPVISNLLPASGSVIYSGFFTGTWSALDLYAGLSGYEYQISTGSDFAILFQTGTVYMTSVSLTGLTIPGNYYRRVRGFDNLGNRGTWQESSIFQIGYSDLSIIKTASTGTVVGDDLFNYTLTYTNNGPDQIGSFTITDTLLSGLNYVSGNPTPTINGQTLTWNINSILGSGQTGAIVFTAQAVQNFRNAMPTGGMVMWVDASAVTGLNDGDPISTWYDKSASGNNMTATSAPTYLTGIINGLPVIDFTTTQDMSIASLDVPDTTIFFVGRPKTLSEGRILSIYDFDPNDWFIGYHPVGYQDAAFSQGYGWYNTYPANPTSNTNFVMYSNITSETDGYLALWRNGVLVGEQSGAPHRGPIGLAINTGDLITIYNNDQRSTAQVAEIIVYNRVLSTGERQSVEQYLDNKYFSGQRTLLENTTNISGVNIDAMTGDNSSSIVLDYREKESDVQVTKIANTTGKIELGDTVSYTINYTNNGPDSASNVVVTDILVTGLNYVSASVAPTTNTVNSTGRTLTWNIGTLANGASGAIVLTATVQKVFVSPDSYDGLVLWTDASKLTGYNGGDAVSLWNDKSGNGNDMVPANPGEEPIYLSTGLNNLPVLDFSTSQNMYTLGFNLSTSDWSTFYVGRKTNTNPGRVLSAPYSYNGSNWLLGYWNLYGDQAFFEGWVSGPYGNGITLDWQVWSAIGQYGNIATVWKNNQFVASNGGGTSGPHGLGVGIFESSDGSQVPEVLQYSRALSSEERQNIDNYLMCKYFNQVTTGSACNVVSITSSTIDTNTGNNANSVMLDYLNPKADVQVTKIANTTGKISVGDAISYTINYKNNGPDSASGVVVTDILVTGLNYVSASVAPTTNTVDGTGRTLTWNIGTLANGAGGSIVLTATVQKVFISPDSYDGLIMWNDASAVTGYNSGDSIGIWNDKSGNGNDMVTLNAGQEPTYVTSGINQTLSVVDFTQSQNIQSANFNLNTSSSSTFYVGRIRSPITSYPGGRIMNTWGFAGGPYGDWVLGFYQGYENQFYLGTDDQYWLQNNGYGFSADTKFKMYSSVINYNTDVNIYRNGSILYNGAGGFVGPNGLTINFPAAGSPLGLNNAHSSNNQTAEVIQYSTALNSTERETIDNYLMCKYFNIATTGSACNVVSITSSTIDTNTGNNANSVMSDRFNPKSDLSITKTASTGTVKGYDLITYTIQYFNAGPDSANGIQINDRLISGLNYISASVAPTINSVDSTGRTLIWSGLSLGVNQTGTIILTAQVVKEFSPWVGSGLQFWADFSDMSSLYQNNACTLPITGTNQPIQKVIDKSGKGNNIYQNTTDNSPITINGGVNSKGFAQFDGSNDVLNTNFKASRTGVPNFSLITVAKAINDGTYRSLWSFDGTVGGWNRGIGTYNGGSSSYEVQGGGGANSISIALETNQYRTISALYSYPTWFGTYIDGVLYTNNTGEQTYNFADENLEIGAASNFGQWSDGQIGEILSYYKTLTTGELTKVHTYLDNKYFITGGLDLLENSVTVSSSTNDTNLCNNRAWSALDYQTQANINVVTTDSPDPITPTRLVTFTLAVTNTGFDSSSGIVATHSWMTGLQFVSASLTGTLNGNMFTFTGFDLENGASQTLVLTALVITGTSESILVYTSTVNADTYDAVLSNNTFVDSTTIPKNADVSITKTASTGAITPLVPFTYTINYTNNGPDQLPIPAISLIDRMAPGLQLLESNHTIMDSGSTVTGSWYQFAPNGGFSSGVTHTLVLTAQTLLGYTSGQVLVNTASILINPSIATDYETSNNTASTGITWLAPIFPTATGLRIFSNTPYATGAASGSIVTFTLTGNTTLSQVTGNIAGSAMSFINIGGNRRSGTVLVTPATPQGRVVWSVTITDTNGYPFTYTGGIGFTGTSDESYVDIDSLGVNITDAQYLSPSASGLTCTPISLILTGDTPFRVTGFSPQSGLVLTASNALLTSHVLTFSDNRSGLILLSDAIGNSTSYGINMNWMDTSFITGSFATTPTAWTSGAVSLILNYNKTGVILFSGNTYTGSTITITGFVVNRTGIVFTGSDSVLTSTGLSCSISYITGQVTNIDLTPPQVTGNYSILSLTSGDVILNLSGLWTGHDTFTNATGGDDIFKIIAFSGQGIYNNISAPVSGFSTGTDIFNTGKNLTFTGNRVGVITVQDQAGWTTNLTASILNIDKAGPTIAQSQYISPSASGLTCTPISLMLTGSEPFRVTGFVPQSGLVFTSSNALLTSHILTFANNWSGSVLIQDSIGFTGSIDVNMNWMDTSFITGSFATTPTAWTSGAVSLILNYNKTGVVLFSGNTYTGSTITITGFVVNRTGIVITGSDSIVKSNILSNYGLQLWLDANDISTLILSGNQVSGWNDKSGNGYSLLQNISNQRPSYVPGFINNLPVLSFNGSQYLSGNVGTGFDMDQLTIVSLASYSYNNGYTSPILNKGNAGGGGSNTFWFSFDGTVPAFYVATAVSQFTGVVGQSKSINTFHKMIGTAGNGKVSLYVNDYFEGSVGYANNINNSTLPLLVGTIATNPGNSDRTLSGNIAEIIVYNRLLNTGERLQAQDYLANKYQIEPSCSKTLITGQITNIDLNVPLLTGLYSSTGITSQPVILTLSGFNTGYDSITNATGSDDYFVITAFSGLDGNSNIPPISGLVTGFDLNFAGATTGSRSLANDTLSWTKKLIFTGNWSGLIYFRDQAGWTNVLTASIQNIDTIAPSCTLSFTPPQSSGLTNQNIQVSMTGSELTIIPMSGIVVNGTPLGLQDLSYNTGRTNFYTMTDNGTFQLIVQDQAGNTGSCNATINWINRDPVTGAIAYAPNQCTDVGNFYTSGSVEVTFTHATSGAWLTGSTMSGNFVRNVKPIETGLVLWLDANNPQSYSGIGTTWYDISGKGKYGTLVNGVSYNATGVKSVVLDGSDDYIDLPSDNDFGFGTGDFTIEIWALLSGSQISTFVDPRPDGVNGAYANLYFDNINNNINYGVNNSTEIIGTTTLSSNVYYHFVTSRVGTTTTLYVNGVNNGSFTDTIDYVTPARIRIGKNAFVNAYRFKGNISTIRVYKGKGLTNSEVSQHYNTGRTRSNATTQPRIYSQAFTANTGIYPANSYLLNLENTIGNTGSVYVAVACIDTTPLSFTGLYTPAQFDMVWTGAPFRAWTNQNIVFTLSGYNTGDLNTTAEDAFSVTGSALYSTSSYLMTHTITFTGNMSGILFTLSDRAGWTSVFTATVDWIDRNSPDLTGRYTPGLGATSGNILLTLSGYNTGFDAVTTGTFDDDLFDIVSPASSGTFVYFTGYAGQKTISFGANWSGFIVFRDKANNTGSRAVNITGIDKDAPTIITGTYSPVFSVCSISGNVVVNITGSELIDIVNFSGTDGYGNTPATTFDISSDGLTTGKSLTFTGNWSGFMNFVDSVGNTGTYPLNISWIDKTALTGSISFLPPQSSGFTSGNVLMTVSLNKTGVFVYGATMYTGQLVTGIAITGNQNITLVITGSQGGQICGNSTGTLTSTVNWIDRYIPDLTGSYSTTAITSGNVTLTLSGYNTGDSFLFATGADDEFIISQFSGVTIAPTSFATGSDTFTLLKTVIFTGNWTGDIITRDRAGNTRIFVTSILNIDKNTPTILTSAYVPSSGTWTQNNVILTLTGSEAIKIISLSTPAPISGFTIAGDTFTTGKNLTFTGNWTGTITFQDQAGNTGSTSVDLFWIDRLATPLSSSVSTGNEVCGAVNSKTLTITGTATGFQGFATTTTGDDEFIIRAFSGTSSAPTTFVTGSDTYNMTKSVLFTGNWTGTIVTLDRAGNTGLISNVNITGIDQVGNFTLQVIPAYRSVGQYQLTGNVIWYIMSGQTYTTGVGFPKSVGLNSAGTGSFCYIAPSSGSQYQVILKSTGYLDIGTEGVRTPSFTGINFSTHTGRSWMYTVGSQALMIPGDVTLNNTIGASDLATLNTELTLDGRTPTYYFDFNLGNVINSFEQGVIIFHAGINGYQYNDGGANVFLGTVNSLWSNTANRSLQRLPLSTENVVISGNVSVDTSPTMNNLTINAGRTFIPTGSARTITINGDLTSNGSVDLSGNAHNLVLNGATNTIGTFNAGSASTVTYSRNGNQNVPSLDYANLIVSNAGTKTALGNITVRGTMFGRALFELSDKDLTVSGVAWFPDYNTSSYGQLSKSGPGNLIFGGEFRSHTNSSNQGGLNITSPSVNIEFRNGLYLNNPTTAGWTVGGNILRFTTNNQPILIGNNFPGLSGITLQIENITLTNTGTNYTAQTIISQLSTDNINGTTAGSIFDNRNTLTYNGSNAPMSIGQLRTNQTGNTFIYGRAGNQNIKSPDDGGYRNLTIQGSGSKVFSGNLNISGNLNNSIRRAYLENTTGNINISGSSTIYGGFNLITGTVINFNNNVFLDRGNAPTRTNFGNNCNINFSTNNIIFTIQSTNLNLNNCFITINNINLTVRQQFSANLIISSINGLNNSSILQNETTLTFNGTGIIMTTGQLLTNQTGNTFIYGSGNQNIRRPDDSQYRNLTFNGGGVKTLLGNVSVANTYILTAPATVNLNGFTLTNP